MIPNPIGNFELTLADVPGPDASLDEIWLFALTFDGYGHCGSFGDCAEIANARRHDSLTNIRVCLFFEQRRWRHFGTEPESEDLAYFRYLVELIRGYVDLMQLRNE